MSADGQTALMRGLEEFVHVGLGRHSERGLEKHD
jgi:hypothetical protein